MLLSPFRELTDMPRVGQEPSWPRRANTESTPAWWYSPCQILQTPPSETPRRTPQETWEEGCLWSEVEKGD